MPTDDKITQLPAAAAAQATELIVVVQDVPTVPETRKAVFGRGFASGLATLNASVKVVQDPANATATPTASKIPIADPDGKLDAWGSNAILIEQRVFQSRLYAVVGFLLISNKAYFVYLGKTAFAMTPKFVEFYVSTAGAGAQIAEIGLFSSPAAPSKAAQSLTKIEATGTMTSLITTGMKRNTTAFSTAIPANTHLWAGMRTAMATTQPTTLGIRYDYGNGNILDTATAGALTAAGPWAGAIIAEDGTTAAPDLRVTLD